ncbi:MAG: helix-turn-helix transcriptional regulator, partial [Oscillospiraceae bacterium]|nr:helix-turn-helix transcriptional regulator [Oscillospiraceae bacterium]
MNPVRVGEQIATQRKKLNMTQTQLAEMLHVSNKSVSRWENGTTMP